MNTPAPHIALNAKKLTIGYQSKGRRQQVVQENLELQLCRGELVCLMGPNGAGKSTLLRTLAGVQAPLAGEVTVGGKSIYTLSQSERAKHISLVLTETINAGNMTVQELVALGRYPHTGWGGSLSRTDEQVVEQAMEDLEVIPLANRLLFELSDGQRQKALIARALAQDGQLIILDEPTAHLDLINRLHIMRLLRQLAVLRNKAIIVATHELDLALQSADKLWLLHKEQGGFTEGTPEDLVLNGSLAAAFSRSGYHFDPYSGQFVEEQEAGVPVQLTGDGAAFLWTKKALRRKGYKVVSADAEIRVTVKSNPSASLWVISSGNISTTVYSVEELLRELEKLQ